VEPEHILYGITAAGFDTTSRLLYALGADRAKLKADITAELDATS
jgi:hypothetical protein